MNKKFLIFVLAAAGIIFLSSFYIPKSEDLPEQAVSTNEIQIQSVLLVIDYGEGNVSSYNLEVENEITAFDLLKNTTDKENIPLETQQYDFGVFVKSVNGLESTAEKAWIYFVNNESGTIAADQQKVNPGDVVEWKYITPSEE
jgi:hypothetical protein